jgi:hypothetical protein
MNWLPAVGWIALVVVSRAESVNWYNPPPPPGQGNLTSSGQPMDGAFQFNLGLFANGFTPTRANIHQWAAMWNPAMTGNYNPSTKVFDEIHTVLSNPVPFLPGASAYVWGRRTTPVGDEWILFRKSDWLWPSPNPMNPFPLDWNAAQADQVILGSINGPGHLMKSESVVSYSQWRIAALEGEPLNGPDDDPDHDGVPNLLEFVFGLPPLQAGPHPEIGVSIVAVSGQNYLRASIPRVRSRLADLTVMVSSDMLLWYSGPEHTVGVSSDETSLVVRDLTPLSAGEGRRFIKLRAVLP